MDRLGASAAVLGPALLLLYLWSEAAFGPSQPSGGPLRMALGFTLVTGGLLCFAFALLRLHAQAPRDAGRLARLGTVLGFLSMALLAIGSALWWPVLFVWPDLGPLAGAAVGLGTLSLFGSWALLGWRAARQRSLPSWVRPLPLALLLLFFLLLVLTGTTAPWTLVGFVFSAFAVGWSLVAYAIWSRATIASGGRASR